MLIASELQVERRCTDSNNLHKTVPGLAPRSRSNAQISPVADKRGKILTVISVENSESSRNWTVAFESLDFPISCDDCSVFVLTGPTPRSDQPRFQTAVRPNAFWVAQALYLPYTKLFLSKTFCLSPVVVLYFPAPVSQEMSSPHRVLIVGAGLTGSLTAAVLRRTFQQNVDLIVWEKSRGAGGRMATKRQPDLPLLGVDTGAQYISATTELYDTHKGSVGCATQCNKRKLGLMQNNYAVA